MRSRIPRTKIVYWALDDVFSSGGYSKLDKLVTIENSRDSYPLEFSSSIQKSGNNSSINNLVMFTSDKSGTLPLVSRLRTIMAIETFLLGLDLKPTGLRGDPLSLRPKLHTDRLENAIKNCDIACWLVNIGWRSGTSRTGTQIPPSLIKKVITALQEGIFLADNCRYQRHSHTDLDIPLVEGFLSKDDLFPENRWPSQEEYEQEAKRLMSRNVLRLKAMDF